MQWLISSVFGLPRYVWGALITAAIAAALLYLKVAERADDEANQTIGRVTERAETTGQVLERVEQGNAVRDVIESEVVRGHGGGLYDQCLLSNRGTAEVCERFLPERSGAER